ncbi:MAG: hypothetical protein D8M58_16440 [Calditrichaeota bacterium]|nr:MAG: hypothetical protein DWQ03_08170 [Calditrichota bacterium]MBL1206995.1 hypothetical protein [Calditrichota bacterium]NOG46822.1 hypothetical protein [Calditrichota bacterium]
MNTIRLQIVKLVLVLSSVLFITNCSSSSSGGGDPILGGDDLTDDIANFVPDSILAKISELGMPIHKGTNPPIFEGTFLASPFVMVSTNRINDNYAVGDTIADYFIRFYEQNNDSLKVSIDYQNGPETGTGIGGYIVGNSNEFTVFAELDISAQGYAAKSLVVYSGRMSSTGILNYYSALLMLDNFGNPGGIWIGNGDGRLFYDEDGTSPTISGFPKSSIQNSAKSISTVNQ